MKKFSTVSLCGKQLESRAIGEHNAPAYLVYGTLIFENVENYILGTLDLL